MFTLYKIYVDIRDYCNIDGANFKHKDHINQYIYRKTYTNPGPLVTIQTRDEKKEVKNNTHVYPTSNTQSLKQIDTNSCGCNYEFNQ